MKLFIDANIFLSFYDFTSNTLSELHKLAHLIQNKEITLLLPQQVVDETWRNRGTGIDRSFKPFRKYTSIHFPCYCRSHESYGDLVARQREIRKMHRSMVKDIQKDIDENRLEADILLRKLFNIGTNIETTPELISSANQRISLGNPPGKKGSIGDAINWESLLDFVPTDTPCFLISADRDYESVLKPGTIKSFLLQEWERKKESSLHFYPALTQFINEHFPDIDLTEEKRKGELIYGLMNSASFAVTHKLIEGLQQYDQFTQKQIEDLIHALLENDQVRWIIGDDDVNEFYRGIYTVYFFSSAILEHHDEIKDLIENSDTIPGNRLVEFTF